MADELLFCGGSRLSDALDEQLRKMRKAVDAEPEGNLKQIDTEYDGFTAETHNRAGHTDIIARHEGRNILICECKFWSGKKGLTETINQLFGYAGWRDTKLAIVMFVREQGLAEIVGKARETLAGHPQFVSRKDAASNTEMRATMHWEGDKERLAELNVFLVHTPS